MRTDERDDPGGMGLGGFTHHAFYDRVHIWLCKNPDKRDIRRLRRFGRVRLSTHPMKFHSTWRARLELFQPSRGMLRAVEALIREDNCLINYVEIALDLASADRAKVERLRGLIDDCLVFSKPGKKGRRDVSCYWRETLYYCTPGAPVNLVVYSDLPSKISGLSCVHIEFRYKGKERVERLGVTRPMHLIGFDLATFWQKRLQLESVAIEGTPESIGRAFIETSPAYQTKRPPYSARRIGNMILRITRGEDHTRGPLAETLRRFRKDYPLFRFAAARLPARIRLGDESSPRYGAKSRRAIRVREHENPELPDELWQKIEDLIPVHLPSPKGGRPRKADRDCMIAILQAGRGTAWNKLPDLGLLPGATANLRWRQWKEAGVFRAMKDRGLDRHEELTDVDWDWLVGS